MQQIYLDNIRGFTDTVIKIRDVTFLIGENSTGKSTFLSVLHILNTFNGSNEVEFDSEIHNMGTFNDIVSFRGRKKKKFTIGVVGEKRSPFHINSDRDTSEKIASLLFLSFGSDEGLPRVVRFSFVWRKWFITICRRNKKYFYRVASPSFLATSDGGPPDAEMSEDIFKKFANLHGQYSSSTYAEFEGKAIPDYHSIIFYLSQIIPKDALGEDNTIGPPFMLFPNGSPIWLAPIRSKPHKTYDGARVRFNAEGSHIPFVLKKRLDKKGTHFESLLERTGKEGNLFEGLEIHHFDNNSSGSGPFEVQVKLNGEKHSLAYVGYGVSQSLPIIVESIVQNKGANIYIQQPEVHLHPKAQASLGDLIYTLASSDRKCFVIETHSDFLIDRFRVAMRAKKSNPRTSVLFFSRSAAGATVQEINVDDNGEYSNSQPAEFREFFLKEQLNVLGL